MDYNYVWDRNRTDEGLVFNNSILMISEGNNILLIDRTNHEVLMIIENVGDCLLSNLVIDNPNKFILQAKLNNQN